MTEAETTMQAVGVSDYEKMRAANLQRNQEIMKMLGLDQTDFRLHEAHKASKGSKVKDSGAAASGKKRKLEEDPANRTTPVRRSTRHKGPANGDDALDTLQDDDVEDEGSSRDSRELRELRELKGSKAGHAEAEEEHLRWAGRQGKQTIVGTASYQHTLKRVLTMDEPALARRIKAIERARGQFAVVKMRLFARVLCLEGYEDLAADATDALKRLVAVLGEPDAEDEVHDAVEA